MPILVLRVALPSDSHQMGASCERTRQLRVTSPQGPGRWQIGGGAELAQRGLSDAVGGALASCPCSAESLSLLQALNLQPCLEFLGDPGDPVDSEVRLSY